MARRAEMSSTLTRLGQHKICFPRAIYRQKPVYANSLKIRLTHNVVPKVTKVEKIILDNIKVSPLLFFQFRICLFSSEAQKATGPLSFSTYMNLCLSHPTHGYYMNSSNKVFGSGGDFITSPEISQVFGEVRRSLF